MTKKIIYPCILIILIITGLHMYLSYYKGVVCYPDIKRHMEEIYKSIKYGRDETKVINLLLFRKEEEKDRFYNNIKESKKYLFQLKSFPVIRTEGILLLQKDENSYYYYRILVNDNLGLNCQKGEYEFMVFSE